MRARELGKREGVKASWVDQLGVCPRVQKQLASAGPVSRRSDHQRGLPLVIAGIDVIASADVQPNRVFHASHHRHLEKAVERTIAFGRLIAHAVTPASDAYGAVSARRRSESQHATVRGLCHWSHQPCTWCRQRRHRIIGCSRRSKSPPLDFAWPRSVAHKRPRGCVRHERSGPSSYGAYCSGEMSIDHKCSAAPSSDSLDSEARLNMPIVALR